MSTNQTATSSSTITVPKARLLPEFISNAVESVNCLSRVILKTCEGTERAVTGVDEISTIMLRQQKERLLADFQRPNQPRTVQIN